MPKIGCIVNRKNWCLVTERSSLARDLSIRKLSQRWCNKWLKNACLDTKLSTKQLWNLERSIICCVFPQKRVEIHNTYLMHL